MKTRASLGATSVPMDVVQLVRSFTIHPRGCVNANTTNLLAGRGKLEHTGDGAEVATLHRADLRLHRRRNHIKRLGRDDGRVHVAVVDNVANHLDRAADRGWG